MKRMLAVFLFCTVAAFSGGFCVAAHVYGAELERSQAQTRAALTAQLAAIENGTRRVSACTDSLEEAARTIERGNDALEDSTATVRMVASSLRSCTASLRKAAGL